MILQAVTQPPFDTPPGIPAPSAAATTARIQGPSRHVAPPPMLREFLDRVVAGVFEVDTTLLRLPTRGRRPIAEARQVAMYLAHVSCGLSFTDIGALFERDRTTVAHACKKTEDRREDPDFDRAIELLERTIRLISQAEAPPCGR